MFNLFNRRPNYRSASANLTRYGVAPELRDRFVAFLERAPERELFHLNPRYLAEKLVTDERGTLKLLVAAVHEGVLKLHWNVRCPACGMTGHVAKFGELHHSVTCPACQNNFNTRLDDEVRVTFSLHPRLRSLPPAADDPAFRAEVDRRLSPVPGQSLLLLPEFQQLFPQEKLLPDESLEVSRVALLFTDLAGSTALYAARGDPRAYHLVRLHFDVLFEAADQNSGAVVKNIGDAIMAAFQTPAQALKAALAMQAGIEALNTAQRLAQDEWLILKIGLHSGPCLNVTLNDRPDYFGTTVNVAARVQLLSRGGDVVFTDVVRRDDEAQKILGGRSIETMQHGLKGIRDELVVHRVAAGAVGP